MTVFDFGPEPQDWCWQSLDEAAQADQWESLSAWVGWLRGRYPISDQLPACWWRHGELVEELTALWVAWLGAYVDPEALATAPVDFHDRWLPALLGRVRRWGVQCQDEHRPRPETVYGNSQVDDPEAFAEFTGGSSRLDDPSVVAGPGVWLDQLPTTAIKCLVSEGYARLVGGFDGAAAVIHHEYWLPAGAVYLRVTDRAVHRQIARDEQRLRMADEAMAEADAPQAPEVVAGDHAPEARS